MELVHDERLRWLLRASAFLYEAGAEPVAGLVLPNGSFFPDAYDGSPASVQCLQERVLAHAGLGDVPVEVQVVAPDGGSASGCKSGGCSAPVPKALAQRRILPLGDRPGYAIAVSAGEVGHPTALTTGLVRAASMIFMAEAELDDEVDAAERDRFVDVAGALLGFGVLLANGAHISHKGCGGVTVQRATVLTVEELVVQHALVAHLFEISTREAKAELDAEPRRMFDAASRWVKANASVLEWVKTDRHAIDSDRYVFTEKAGLLSRWFGGHRSTSVPLPTDAELLKASREMTRPKVPSEKARRMAALRVLVDETLD